MMTEKEQNRLHEMYGIECQMNQNGYAKVAGVDEAGRGPLCGPVVTAAVIFDGQVEIEGLNDSKKLSEKKREFLYNQIIQKALCYAISSSDVACIEQVNILNATKLAMKKSVEMLSIKPDIVLIDGNQKIDIKIPQVTVVGGDAKSASIAAASILAKVTRDRLLEMWDKQYPVYGFAKHKGYGTKAHVEAIKKYGLCELHRPSFCKKIKMGDKNENV